MEDKEVRLKEYTYFGLHLEAKLTDTDCQIIIYWAKSQMAYLKFIYPANSLVRKKKK